ncbi:MAG: hypothetical protein HYX75_19250 [Acidobacteria bacterium]|nr:hypothetical protein [Acidobacteriota bacterium]
MDSPPPAEDRIDRVLQFILAAAGQRDPAEQELGPIHLIKYVYLGDLAHAERNNGQTYTGAPWKFYHFGPWSVEIFERVDPALLAVGADRLEHASARYEADVLRYRLTDDDILDRRERELPHVLTSIIRSCLREFSNDTHSLLHHVYRTWPMLIAAPGDLLSFAPPAESDVQVVAESGGQEDGSEMTSREKRLRRDRLAVLRGKIRERLEETVARSTSPPTPPPRYDEVFADGVAWLDELAGSPPEPVSGEVQFSTDVWRSPTRRDPEVP